MSQTLNKQEARLSRGFSPKSEWPSLVRFECTEAWVSEAKTWSDCNDAALTSITSSLRFQVNIRDDQSKVSNLTVPRVGRLRSLYPNPFRRPSRWPPLPPRYAPVRLRQRKANDKMRKQHGSQKCSSRTHCEPFIAA
jgi:hypothetical protein